MFLILSNGFGTKALIELLLIFITPVKNIFTVIHTSYYEFGKIYWSMGLFTHHSRPLVIMGIISYLQT